MPHSIVAAAEAAVDGAAVDAASPLWEEQPDPEDLEEMRSLVPYDVVLLMRHLWSVALVRR